MDASFFRVDLHARNIYIHLGNLDDYYVFEPKSRCGMNKNIVGSKMMVHSRHRLTIMEPLKEFSNCWKISIKEDRTMTQ